MIRHLFWSAFCSVTLISLLPEPEFTLTLSEFLPEYVTFNVHHLTLGRPVTRYRPYLSAVADEVLLLGQENETRAAPAGLFEASLTTPEMLAARMEYEKTILKTVVNERKNLRLTMA